MKISDEMIEQIKEFEGCRLEAYSDSAGIPTIGIGHTGNDVSLGDKISRSEATRLFRRDITYYEEQVNKLNGILLERSRGLGGLTQRQYDALVSLVYNCGANAIRKDSVFFKILTNGGRNNYASICHAFMQWNKITKDGEKIVSKGLTFRRAKEAAWYVYGFNYKTILEEHGIKDVVSWAKN